MSWLFSRVLVEEYLGDISSDGEQSAPSNGNPTQLAYLLPDKMTDFSRLFQFGMTYKPLTDDRGEELLTLYRAAFPVRTSAKPIKTVTDSMENEAECGKKWHGSLAKYDLNLCSWKTHQCSLLGGLELFSETWPKWGSMRNGECWERTMWGHTIEGKEFGWLPTPVASDWMTGQTNGIHYKNRRFVRISQTTGTEFGAKLTSAYRLMTGNHLPASFSEWMMGWPVGWTDLKRLEMDRFLPWQRSHSKPYCQDSKRAV